MSLRFRLIGLVCIGLLISLALAGMTAYSNASRSVSMEMRAAFMVGRHTIESAVDRLQNQFKIKGKLQFADHDDWRIIAAQGYQVTAANLALDTEAEVFKEAFDGKVKRGFQGELRVAGATQWLQFNRDCR